VSAPTPTSFEDQVATALHQRAAAVTAPADARAAIDRRLGQRARTRRLRRVGVAAAVVVVLIAGALAVVQRGHDDASVVTGPGDPVVQFPHLVAPPPSTVQVVGYSPGREIDLAFLPAGPALSPPASVEPSDGGSAACEPCTTAQVDSATLRMTVSEASFDEVGRSLGATAPGTPLQLGPHPAVYVPNRVGGDFAGTLVWNPAPGVIAQLSTVIAGPVEPEVAARTTLLLAGGLVEVDQATWEQLIDPTPTAPRLGLPGDGGHGEILSYSPTGGRTVQILDVAGFPPASMQLTARSGGDEATLDAVDDPDHVDVRGTSGLLQDTSPLGVGALGFGRSLTWVEDGSTYELAFTDAISSRDAVKVANRFTVLTPAEWHALLFPTTLRTDLVPMPTFQPYVAPPEGLPSASTTLSVPTNSTTTTTGG
jgi:hypothetical protein